MGATPQVADVHAALVARLEARTPCVRAVLIEADGSTPAGVGAQAVLDADGAIHGTVGGGALEAQVQRAAQLALREGGSRILEFALRGDRAGALEPICGGVARVLVTPVPPEHLASYAAAATPDAAPGERRALLTFIEGTHRVQVRVRCVTESRLATDAGSLPRARIRQVLETERPALIPLDPSPGVDRSAVFVEPLVPAPTLVIAGGGHVGQAVAAQAVLVGFHVLVVDDRVEFTRPGLFPSEVRCRCAPIATALAERPLDRRTYVVIVTRGHEHDAEVLAACLAQPVAYLGMIGSRRKVALLRQAFLASGRATAAEFDRVYAPIGLDLGAETVPEIATSIVAQLIAVRRRGTAPRRPTAAAPA